MKIQPAVYSALKSDISEVARALGVNLATSDGGKTGLKTIYLLLDKACKDRTYDDTHAGFAGGHWKRILPHTGRAYCFYYEGGCNDTHVATALRGILRELTA